MYTRVRSSSSVNSDTVLLAWCFCGNIITARTFIFVSYEHSLLVGEVRRTSRKYQFKKQIIFSEPRGALGVKSMSCGSSMSETLEKSLTRGAPAPHRRHSKSSSRHANINFFHRFSFDSRDGLRRKGRTGRCQFSLGCL